VRGDPCKVIVPGEDDDILPVPCYVHKVTLSHADGTAATRAELHDNVTADDPVLIELRNNATGHATVLFKQFVQADFDPPVLFEKGLSTDISGTGILRIFYTL
jgi:hypothetical protein